MMECPYCGSLDSKVVDSRDTADHSMVRRRRMCLKCGKGFTTYEFAMFKKAKNQTVSASLIAFHGDPKDLCAELAGICGPVGMTLQESADVINTAIKMAKHETPIYSQRYSDYLILRALRQKKFAYFASYLLFKFNITSPAQITKLWDEGDKLQIKNVDVLGENCDNFPLAADQTNSGNNDAGAMSSDKKEGMNSDTSSTDGSDMNVGGNVIDIQKGKH